MEPVWFIVARGAGGKETPSVVVGVMPSVLTRKIPKDAAGNPCEPSPLIYSLRLDKLPTEQRCRWIDDDGVPVWPVTTLYRTYCKLRDRGELPTLTG
jgi:hypothetical protein